MKITLLFVAMALPLMAQAKSVVAFSCEEQSGLFMNQFSTDGVVEVADDGSAKGQLGFDLTSMVGSGPATSSLSAMEMEGTSKVIPAGQYMVHDVQMIQVRADGKIATIVLGGPANSSSLMVDGTRYLATCKAK